MPLRKNAGGESDDRTVSLWSPGVYVKVSRGENSENKKPKSGLRVYQVASSLKGMWHIYYGTFFSLETKLLLISFL